jgi:hypothetical protein
MVISGIITTNLGKTATFAKGAGRERRVHHSKSLPLSLTGERLFFVRNLPEILTFHDGNNARKCLCYTVTQ